MGDFERTFGAGANIDSIISGFDRAHRAEQRHRDHEARSSSKKTFRTFKEAADWAKSNPGKSFTRSLDGNGFTEI
jgi:hypothetical protein